MVGMKKEFAIVAAVLASEVSGLSKAPSTITIGTWTPPAEVEIPEECTNGLPAEGTTYTTVADFQAALVALAPKCPAGFTVGVAYDYTELTAEDVPRCAEGTPGNGQAVVSWAPADTGDLAAVLQFNALGGFSFGGTITCAYPDHVTTGQLGSEGTDACTVEDQPAALIVAASDNKVAYTPSEAVPATSTSVRISTTECQTMDITTHNMQVAYDFLGTYEPKQTTTTTEEVTTTTTEEVTTTTTEEVTTTTTEEVTTTTTEEVTTTTTEEVTTTTTEEVTTTTEVTTTSGNEAGGDTTKAKGAQAALAPTVTLAATLAVVTFLQ